MQSEPQMEMKGNWDKGKNDKIKQGMSQQEEIREWTAASTMTKKTFDFIGRKFANII